VAPDGEAPPRAVRRAFIAPAAGAAAPIWRIPDRVVGKVESSIAAQAASHV